MVSIRSNQFAPKAHQVNQDRRTHGPPAFAWLTKAGASARFADARFKETTSIDRQ
jgi:hypothetical protein